MFITNVLLACVASLLVLIFCALIIKKPPTPTQPDLVLINLLNDAIEGFGKAAQHHIDVSAVVKLVQQLDADPNALELIKSYPETVRAAAWLHYINTLGADLRRAQQRLSESHAGKGYVEPVPQYIDRDQARVDALRTKLDKAVEASGQTGLRPV